MGVFVEAGSVHAAPGCGGVAQLIEALVFRGTKTRTPFRLNQEVEAIGGVQAAAASREQLAVSLDVPASNVAEAVEILADCVVNPRFQQWMVDEEVTKLEAGHKALEANPHGLLLEAANTVGYTGGLGEPLIAPKEQLANLSADYCAQFHAENFTGGRVALAVSGAEQAEVVTVGEELLAGLPAGRAPAVPSAYKGGEIKQHSGGDLAHALLGYEFKGGWRDVKGSVVMTVLQMLMGGGGSFSAGGPGKGMHSRLYKRVLNNCPWVTNCTGFSSLYNDTGIVGIIGSADAAKGGDLVDTMYKEMEAVAAGGVTDVELERAKNCAIASIWMNLESKPIVCEDIGRQLLTYGKRTGGAEFAAEIAAVTKADITNGMQKLMKSAPTLVACGDVSTLPTYDSLASRS